MKLFEKSVHCCVNNYYYFSYTVCYFTASLLAPCVCIRGEHENALGLVVNLRKQKFIPKNHISRRMRKKKLVYIRSINPTK